MNNDHCVSLDSISRINPYNLLSDSHKDKNAIPMGTSHLLPFFIATKVMHEHHPTDIKNYYAQVQHKDMCDIIDGCRCIALDRKRTQCCVEGYNKRIHAECTVLDGFYLLNLCDDNFSPD